MEDVKARFLRDVADHEVKILKDDGVYRHIKFSRQNSMTYCFDLITWPGHLAITGDMGDYIFSRIEDMFDFFGTRDGELNINIGYWCQKLRSVSKFGCENGKLNKFDAEGTLDTVLETAEEIIDDEDELEEFKGQLCKADTEEEAMDIMTDSNIEDNYEYLCHKPNFHIQWILYAIVWGITQYKDSKSHGLNV